MRLPILAGRITFPAPSPHCGLLLVQPCAGQQRDLDGDRQSRSQRDNHTATLLPDGKVLVAGAKAVGGISASAELYDPASGTWTATGSLATAREVHTATLLPNGKVLVAGGLTAPTRSRERGTLRSGERHMDGDRQPRHRTRLHTATLLPNGKVLVAGGSSSFGDLASAELYDPASGTWTATGSLTPHATSHTATLLPNGKVLVAGG